MRNLRHLWSETFFWVAIPSPPTRVDNRRARRARAGARYGSNGWRRDIQHLFSTSKLARNLNWGCIVNSIFEIFSNLIYIEIRQPELVESVRFTQPFDGMKMADGTPISAKRVEGLEVARVSGNSRVWENNFKVTKTTGATPMTSNRSPHRVTRQWWFPSTPPSMDSMREVSELHSTFTFRGSFFLDAREYHIGLWHENNWF